MPLVFWAPPVRPARIDAPVSQVDVLLADLGISSTQLDDVARGFSFQRDGQLDLHGADRSQLG